MRGTFLYPDPQDGSPISSIPWELFRDGLEDYEMLRLLKLAADDAQQQGRNHEAVARAQRLLEQDLPALIRSPKDFSWDPLELENLRTRAGETLSELSATR